MKSALLPVIGMIFAVGLSGCAQGDGAADYSNGEDLDGSEGPLTSHMDDPLHDPSEGENGDAVEQPENGHGD